MRISAAFYVLWAAWLVSTIVSPCTVNAHAPGVPSKQNCFYPCRNTLMLALAARQWKNWMENLTMWKYSATNIYNTIVLYKVLCSTQYSVWGDHSFHTAWIILLWHYSMDTEGETHEYISTLLPCLSPTGWCALLWPGMTSEYSRAHPSLVGLAAV